MKAWYQPPCYWQTVRGGELVTSIMSKEEVRQYLASIGSKGGKATGESKKRGDTEYYRRISKKAAAARKKKRAAAHSNAPHELPPTKTL